MAERNIVVRWYDCDCDWITKYCEENHQQAASVPESVLKAYTVASS